MSCGSIYIKGVSLMRMDSLLGRCEWILCWVEVTLREVVVDLVNGDTHVLENLPEILTLMAETIFPPIISLFQKKSLTLPT